MAKQHGSSKEVESLRLENEALRTRLATFSEFLGMVSHELRTPLTTIKGSTATVLSDPSVFDPAETRQFFRIIDEQADLLRDLINNLLDLTRIEAGASLPNLRTCRWRRRGTPSCVAEHGTTSLPNPTDVVYLVAEARKRLHAWRNTERHRGRPRARPAAHRGGQTPYRPGVEQLVQRSQVLARILDDQSDRVRRRTVM